MGTSVNQASPRTLSWSAAQAAYRDSEIPVERAAKEIWRAATNRAEGDISMLLGAAIVGRIGELAVSARNSLELAKSSSIELATSKQASLAGDIARRAALRAIGTKDRVMAYNEKLFAEATAYLVSRDLPGFVGIGRAKTVKDSVQFRSEVMDHVAGVVRGVGPPSSFEQKGWKQHVRNVVSALLKSSK